jgi:hypothetical protein
MNVVLLLHCYTVKLLHCYRPCIFIPGVIPVKAGILHSFRLAMISVVNVANATAVTELSGINMADSIGVSRPAAANEIPMML